MGTEARSTVTEKKKQIIKLKVAKESVNHIKAKYFKFEFKCFDLLWYRLFNILPVWLSEIHIFHPSVILQ